MPRATLLLFVLILLFVSACGGTTSESDEFNPIDLVPWGQDTSSPKDDLGTTPKDVDEPEPDTVVPTPTCAPGEAPNSVRVLFSRNVFQYNGQAKLCAGQDLGLRAEQLIDMAGSTIDMAAMEVQDYNVVDALVAAANRGVAIRIMLDDTYYLPQEYDTLKDMEHAGIKIFPDKNGSPIMHNKFMIVDDRWLWTGSANFSSYDATSNANVVLLFDSPPMAAIYSERFSRLWGNQTLATSDAHTKQSDQPKRVSVAGIDFEIYFTPSWGGVDRLTELIGQARTSIHFQIFAFTLDEVRDAIESRCGEVEIIGIYDPDQAEQYASVVKKINCASAKILPADLSGNSGYNLLHHKLLIVDGSGSSPWIATGSMNWSKAAAEENDENLVVFSSRELAKLFEAEFATRLQEAEN